LKLLPDTGRCRSSWVNAANIAELPMPGNQSSVPMTYTYQNRQFIVMAVAGRPAGQLVAFAWPLPAPPGGRGGRGGAAPGAER
jgi:hypothetical protein